jgi:hypothetical protein
VTDETTDIHVPVVVGAAPVVAAPATASDPAPASGGPGLLGLERRSGRTRSATRAVDWIALVLAFLAPPLGLILGIAAAVSGSRSRGYAAAIAKAAIGIGVVLSILLTAAVIVESKVAGDRAAHAAVVASSRLWCSRLNASPTTLTSDTYGWPAPGNTIPSSIAAIKSYQSRWASLAAVAPAGIRSDTQKFADTAKSIAATVESTQTLNDAGNVVQLQNLVATTGIKEWDSKYCG